MSGRPLSNKQREQLVGYQRDRQQPSQLMIGNASTNPDDLDWRGVRKRPAEVHATRIDEPFSVQTLEGVMTGKAGDFLIRGIDGELYPCDADIFKRTYDIIVYD